MSKKRVLFLCTGNSCRSQMAEGLVNHYLGDRWEAFSAGTKPSGYVHPLAVRAMAELGIDISSHRSKSTDEVRDVAFDRVITVCDHAAKNCPAWLGQGVVQHIGFPDPASAEGSEDERLMAFRSVRDGLRREMLVNLLERGPRAMTFVMHAETEHSRNFNVAIYARVYEVQQMADLEWLRTRFDVMNRHIKVDKVYLETHRDTIVADEETIAGARQFFEERGIYTSGGITLTVNERNRFETYCYTNPAHRKKVQEVVEYTSRLFDEVILDDFFFTNCKCASCIKAKGKQSWTEFRLALMTEAARSLVLGPARAANPQVKVVIKYPNWYEHFQGLGFDLETEPPLFDGLYTGTETRDPVYGNQHLQQYHGYSIFRYFENIKPGGNGGGWVDTGGMRTLDRYAEQLWLTLFAKAPEITLFDFRQLQRPIEASHRAGWQDAAAESAQDGEVRFDFDAMIAPVRKDEGTWPPETTVALAAGYALEQVDPILKLLGQPVGLKSCRPYHATGEDYLHSYLGMLGIPIDLVPQFPAAARTVLLTESAKFDPGIVDKIEAQLMDGKTVVVTSGLFKALQHHGLRDIAELMVTDRKANVQDFLIGWFRVYHSESALLIPHVDYLTNDSWEEISGLTRTTGHPLLHSAAYGNGMLYVLTIPDNFDDLYKLPAEVLARIRAVLLGDLYVRVDGPAQVALFVYDNDTFIVESFLPETAEIRIIVDDGVPALCDALSGQSLSGEPILDWRGQRTGKTGFEAALNPHSLRVFRLEK